MRITLFIYLLAVEVVLQNVQSVLEGFSIKLLFFISLNCSNEALGMLACVSVCACLSMEEWGRESHITAYIAVQVPIDYRRMSEKVT